jgi:hypothetical protein
MTSELEWVWKEAVMVCFRVIPWSLYRKTEKDRKFLKTADIRGGCKATCGLAVCSYAHELHGTRRVMTSCSENFIRHVHEVETFMHLACVIM